METLVFPLRLIGNPTQSLLFGEVELMETIPNTAPIKIPVKSLLFGEVELMETQYLR